MGEERRIYSSSRSRSNFRSQEVNIPETGLPLDEIDTRISRPGSKLHQKGITFYFRLNSSLEIFFSFQNPLERGDDLSRSIFFRARSRTIRGSKNGREEWPTACEARDMWDSWLNGDRRGGQFPVNDRLLSG